MNIKIPVRGNETLSLESDAIYKGFSFARQMAIRENDGQLNSAENRAQKKAIKQGTGDLVSKLVRYVDDQNHV